MDIPLISGLAAALYLESVLPGPIPETIEEQASFYHRFYDNSTSAHDIYGKANAIHFKSMYKRMYRSFEYVGDVSEKKGGVFNATFNNISVISWWSILMLEESGVPRENR